MRTSDSADPSTESQRSADSSVRDAAIAPLAVSVRAVECPVVRV
ncbi:hypothetical protein [Streptomyces sp. NBC_01276]